MLYLPIIVSIFSLVFAYFLIREIKKADSGSGKQIEISFAIREGATAFLKRQYQTIGVVAIFLSLILWLILGCLAALGFLIGAISSGLAGFIGMMISTQANLKVAEAAKSGLKKALDLSFKAGSITGFLVVGLGLLSISLFYLLTGDLKALIALAFGSSLISVFASLAGGIYTKAADVGADLVGKIEKGIPEDDPRNPAVIADQVGDNVGDCAGMAADLFQTYVVTMVAAMLLASLLFPNLEVAVLLPLILASVAILTSIISTFFVRLGKNKSIISALLKAPLGVGILSALAFLPIISKMAPVLELSEIRLYLPALIGILLAFFIFLITDYFTSKKHSPVQTIALASQSGHSSNIIAGLAMGMKATILPVLLISAGILLSFGLAGIYGLAIAVVSMLSLTGIIVALAAYGPITDNASGILEMAGLSKENRKITDALDAVGNTTKATAKSYAIASAGLAALVLFSVYKLEAVTPFFLADPQVLIGLFIGGIIVYYFAALSMTAVDKAARKVVEEVRRQFREIPGLMEGKAKPDYGTCVDIVTKSALKEMRLPGLLPVIVPILVGFILGTEALAGVLIGAIMVGIFLAISMTSGGAAWDNAKKYIEEGNLGGKGSFAHQAAVTGDTVGDPYKDTAGPALNPMIKVLNIVALLLLTFLV